MPKTRRQCMKGFLFHTLPRHSIECLMRNRQRMTDPFRILHGKTRDLTRASGSECVHCTSPFVRECPFYLNYFNKKWFCPALHENGGANWGVGEGVMIYSWGWQPRAHVPHVARGSILRGNLHYSTTSSIFELFQKVPTVWYAELYL
ncbi:hypothetical protein TNCV_3050021 [Trichonephila clavipes]|nr:hypothetical protein TNCV_3050021 [Trichonephila clavipes]